MISAGESKHSKDSHKKSLGRGRGRRAKEERKTLCLRGKEGRFSRAAHQA